MIQIWRAFGYLVPLFFISILATLLPGYLLYRKRIKHLDSVYAFKSTVIDLLLILNVLGILMVTLLSGTWGRPSTLQLVPFESIKNVILNSFRIMELVNLLLNIILFIPLGFLLYWRLNPKKILVVTMSGLIFSVLIELTQYILPVARITSIDDILLNTLGTAIGTWLFLLLRKLFPKLFGYDKRSKITNLNEIS